MISLFKVFMSETIPNLVGRVLTSGYITQGQIVDTYEKELSKYLTNEYVLSLNSATSGLTLALRLLIKPNDELNWGGFDIEKDYVLSTPLTCFATNTAILENNCKLKWVDVDINTGNMSMDDLKNKLTKHSKIIYLVHWGGNPVLKSDMNEIKDYCFNKYGYRPIFVEDCAHAFSSKYEDNTMIGSNNGNIQVFSTQAIKLLTTVDGGIITLPCKSLYDRAKLLRWYGIDRNKRNYKKKDFRLEHDITEHGYKYHMNDVNATIGLENLKYINDLVKINRQNAEYYDKNLQNIKSVRLLKQNLTSSYWLYTICVKNKVDFIEYMKDNNIMVSQVHQRNDIFSCLKESKCELPILDKLETELVCIPVGWWLSKIDLEHIVKCIKQWE